MLDVNELLESVPHDGRFHTVKLSVRREGFGLIVRDGCIDGERLDVLG